ncbi:hypothetical protein BDZ89DRAFT_474786 [Hymenopellis radicata]|nr:hypothetical protein BDZ89DRAFT_474786 [Hymenopellis radicata]
MSSSSSSNYQPSSTPTASAPSRIVVSVNSSPDDTAFTSKDIQQALLLLPPNVQRLIMTIQHLLQTNDAPSSQDSVIISECGRLIDDHVARLDATISLASTATPHICTAPLRMPSKQSPSIDKQMTQRADLQRLRERVHSVNSAVRRIPQEIWQEVFLFVRTHDAQVDVFNPQDPVYAVGQVCQLWHHASQSCPWLWSRVLFSVPRLLDLSQGVVSRLVDLSRGVVSRLREVLKRSRNVPLDFVFTCGCGIVDEELLIVLMQYSSRWRSAEFLEMTLANAQLFGNVRGRVPLLESMRLNLERGGSERTDVISAFEIAPKLTRVDLCCVQLEQVVLDSRVKQNIQYLRVGNYPDKVISTPSLSDILGDFCNLTTVDVCCRQTFGAIIPWSAFLPPDTPRLVHANVTFLRVGEGDCLRLVSLPNLTSLDVGSDGPNFIPGLLSCVISFLQHSRCRLTSLHLHCAGWDEHSMGVLLGLVPDLRTLSISSGGCPVSTTRCLC